uniref:Xylulose kinase-1 n=1 Tax=Tanacetum cinerariifolium TaxID=118510 RepID=A0A699IXQ9_TANCI|nr:hypothetical protein [Tanacetum cinerariifolium]
MARLAFCDYHNMIAILEKSEHNVNFHQIVDFVEASHIRYALTINLTVYVSHIRQFWSTARIETTNEGINILTTIDGKPRTISESLIRRNLKLNYEEGISTLPDAEIFENLALMGYNILPNQKFTFQKGTLTEPHHTPSPQAQQSPHHDLSSSLHPTATTETIPTKTPIEIPTLRQYSQRATRIAQSKALPTTVDEPTSPFGDDTQGEAFPTVFGLEARQDREDIIKISALPHDSTARVTSLDADEGTQDLEISSLKAKIKLLEDKDKGSAKQSGDDALIKGRSLETWEEVGVEKSTEQGSNDTEELKEEQMAREDQRIDEQIVRDAEIAKIHAEEELQMLINGLDRNNEVIAKHLQEYEQSAAELTIRKKIDLINERVKYHDHHAKILKYQAQQSKPLFKKQQREFYMSVLKSHSRWKTKHFRGMKLEEIKEKFIPVWKQIEDFVPMASKEEGERFKRKGLRLE